MRVRVGPGGLVKLVALGGLIAEMALIPGVGRAAAVRPPTTSPPLLKVGSAATAGRRPTIFPATVAATGVVTGDATDGRTAYGALPLAFEANRGQTDGSVAYLARGAGYTLFLRGADLTLTLAAPHAPLTPTVGSAPLTPTVGSAPSLSAALPVSATRGAALRLRFVGANPTARAEGLDPLPGVANYLRGDASHWVTGVPTYARVRYASLYPGIDLAYYGTAGRLENDWTVAPGADPRAIRLAVEGARGVALDGRGALVLDTAAGALAQGAPAAYQVIDGVRHDITVGYTLAGAGTVGFTVGAYDTSQPLVIDPVFSYSTYLGGLGTDGGTAIAVDGQSDAYVTGSTQSLNFPTTTGAYSTTAPNTNGDVFVSKLNPGGTALVYSTYIGGDSNNAGMGIAVDGHGDAYVTGSTNSPNFPTVNAVQGRPQGGVDAFALEVSASGSALVYSTYLGGSSDERGNSIALDGAGDAYIAGQTSSSNFPTTAGVLQPVYGGGGNKVFVTKLGPAGALVYSTYLGGSGADVGTGIAVDASGDAYVTGSTVSSNFPTVNAFQPTSHGNNEAFVSKLNPPGSALVYSTYLGGGSDDLGTGIAVDAGGSAYVTGRTNSGDFPTLHAVQPLNRGSFDAYITKLTPAGNALVYSTYLGAGGDDFGNAIAVDGAGDAYVTGQASTTTFPVVNAPQPTYGDGGIDAFVAAVDAAGSGLVYSTYLGGNGQDFGYGIAVDAGGSAYVTGQTGSTTFPTTAHALQGGGGGGTDAFVTKVGHSASGLIPWHPHNGGMGALGNGIDVSVDLADGHVDVGMQDMSIPGRGPDLTVNRTWDSALAGSGITTTALAGLVSSLTPRIGGSLQGTVTYTDTSGAVWGYLYNGPLNVTSPYTAYVTPAGQPWQLTTTALNGATTGYTLTNILSGEVMSFDGSGRLSADADAYGNANTMGYASASDTSPNSETNSGGRSLALSAANGQLTDVQSPQWASSSGAQGQHVAYGYNASGQLTTRTLGAGTADAVTTTFGYSGTQMVTMTTPANRAWQLGYDMVGRVTSLTSPASGTVGQAGYTPSYTTQYTYGLTGTQAVEGAGTSGAVTTTYTLDALGQPITVTDGLDNSSGASYDVDHGVLTRTDADGHVTTNTYQYIGPNGAIGQVVEEDQPAIQPYVPGNSPVTPVITHTYDQTTHDLVATKLPEGGLTTYSYDGRHSVSSTVEQTTCAICATTWQGTINGYDAYGERTSTTDGRGVNAANGAPTLNGQANAYTSHMGYSPQGDLASESTPPLTTTLNGVTTTASAVTTTYTYDGDGNRQTMVSANGNASASPASYTTSYGYDHLGRQTVMTLPAITLYNNTTTQPVQTTGYDADGHMARETDGKGDTTLSSYDPLGRLIAETNPVSGTMFSVYNATELASQQDPQGNVTAYNYDAAGRTIGQADPLTGTVQYGYDAVGNTVAMTQGDSSGGVAQVETMGYDAQDRVTTDTVTAPATGTVTTLTAYDQDGNVAQTVQPRGDVTYNVYDAADRLTAVEIDAAPISKAGAVAHARYEAYSYDAAGNVVQSTDADNRTTTTQYDGDTRPVGSVDTATDASGTTTITTTTGYDPNGNTVSRATTTQKLDGTSETHTATSNYNANDQPTGTTDDGYGTSYGYDAADQVRSETTTDGATSFTNNLDAAGRVTSVAEGAGGAGSYTSQFGYNADSLPSTIALPGGVSEQARYDADSNLTGLTVAGPNMGTITNTLSTTYGYAYNGQGLETSETTISGTDTVTHDPATGRLSRDCGTQVEAPGGCYRWSYDGNGNITSQVADNGQSESYTYDPARPNTLTQTHAPGYLNPDTYYGYDGNGDTTSITSPVTGSLTVPGAINTALSYDAEGRVTQVAHRDNKPFVATLAYDAQGRRARYTVVMSGTVIDDERFSYRGGALGSVVAVTATVNATGTVTSRGGYTDTYIDGPQGEPLEFVRAANGQTMRYFYVLDGRGSVVAVTDASGKVVDRYNYDLWGEPIGKDDQTVPQPLRYAGYWYDGELQWYWLAGRQYDPEIQRFLQPDPTDLDGTHTYVYANDDPVDLIEVGGAFSVSGFFHHAVQFLDSAAHVTFKVAEAAWNAVAGDDVHVICCTSYPVPIKALAVLDLAITVIPGADAAKLLEVGAKTAAKAGGEQAAFALVRWIAGKTDGKVAADLSDNVLRDAFRSRKTGGSSALRDAERAAGCALCFPAGTQVATAHGAQAIQTLHVGDVVQAENPATGKVEAEAVQAVIQDPVSPLIAVELSDGSAITVTADHPFWVDGGAQLAGAGWFAAGRLQAGDELRTAAGVPVMVVGLRRNVGTAVVYTLTVAKDHTFFVGSAEVLVHNANCGLNEEEIQRALQALKPNDYNHIFGKAQHDLAPLEAQFGSQQRVVEEILRLINKSALPASGPFAPQIVVLAGKSIEVSGVVINGVVRIGTFFVKP